VDCSVNGFDPQVAGSKLQVAGLSDGAGLEWVGITKQHVEGLAVLARVLDDVGSFYGDIDAQKFED
jgi:hypothetical protein